MLFHSIFGSKLKSDPEYKTFTFIDFVSYVVGRIFQESGFLFPFFGKRDGFMVIVLLRTKS